ncbi:MAG: hypothetical protein D6679_03290 [Candidatus Hydrogenedentota bacterium]|nr:MAG: hypothetical protein D6679_03290 [Candidatus Hydrogenedentota bacterium]
MRRESPSEPEKNTEGKHSRRSYNKPLVRRYRLARDHIKEYQGATGPVNSKLCKNPDNCNAGRGFGMPAMPEWLIP